VPTLARIRLSEPIQLTDLQLKEDKRSKKAELNPFGVRLAPVSPPLKGMREPSGQKR